MCGSFTCNRNCHRSNTQPCQIPQVILNVIRHMNHFEHWLNLNCYFVLHKIIARECTSSKVNFIKRKTSPNSHSSALAAATTVVTAYKHKFAQIALHSFVPFVYSFVRSLTQFIYSNNKRNETHLPSSALVKVAFISDARLFFPLGVDMCSHLLWQTIELLLVSSKTKNVK